MHLTDSDISRFWVKVDKDGPIHPYNPSLGKCWVWMSGINNKGYGAFDTNHSGVRKTHLVHRISFTLSNGPINDGMKILHSCDNPPCCNPAHLREGTQAENMQESASRGRCGKPHEGQRGEKNYRAKLTEELVREIRLLYSAGGISQEAIGARYGVKRSTILGVVSRRKWAHVA